MHDYSLTHLPDAVLLRDLSDLARRDRENTAALLAHIAEVDARKLYRPPGYPSMLDYCVGRLHMSDGAARKRIQAARTARRFPALFPAVAEGRIHLAGLCLLAPHLTEADLLAASTHRTKDEIEALLSRRASTPSLHGVRTSMPEECANPCAPGRMEGVNSAHAADRGEPSVTVPEFELEAPRPTVPERCVIRMTVDRATQERLRYAQSLLSHAVPSGDVAQVFDRALVALISQLERRKFGAGARPRARVASGSRYIPADVRHAVWHRDQGRCTFIGTDGHRCASKWSLQFDHVQPYAMNPEATVEGLRLRCRAHNQYEAERTFGAEFMSRKREQARRRVEQRRRTENAAGDPARERHLDVLAALSGLGIKGEQARRAAERALSLQNATLEECIRAALQYHGERVMRNPRAARLLSASG